MPKPAVIQLVQEFYANLNPQNLASMMARGKNVCWTAEAINKVYNLPNYAHGTFN